MSNLPTIPQFGLQNSAGKQVRFDFMLWGNKDQQYDFEKPHRHNFNEVLVFYKGGGTHDIDFSTYTAKNKSIHFVASNNVHLVLRSKNSEGCSLLFSNDYFNHELISQLPFSTINPTLQLNTSDFGRITQLIYTIKAEYLDKKTGYEAIIQAHMQAFMLYLVRIYTNQHPEKADKSNKPELVNRFINLIPKQYINHFTVNQYAEALTISTKHLIELVKTHTGKTPLQHIKEYTIAEAKKLLFHTQLSVKEIAYQLNFDDPTNFSKYFKAATGYTPIQYREGIGN